MRTLGRCAPPCSSSTAPASLVVRTVSELRRAVDPGAGPTAPQRPHTLGVMGLVGRSVSPGIAASRPAPLQTVGSALTRGPFTTRLANLAWDRRLAISTRGVIPVAHEDSHHYATMNYRTIWPILDHLALGPSDVFVDVGCGKGRVLCCAAHYPVGKVIGVDLS